MAKRSANTVLTHDNWNEESPPEEPGVFQVASNEDIKRRVFKTAKRRLGDSSVGSPFSGFGGFGSGAKAGGVSFTFLNENASGNQKEDSSDTKTESSIVPNGHVVSTKVETTTAVKSVVLPVSSLSSTPTESKPTSELEHGTKRACFLPSPEFSTGVPGRNRLPTSGTIAVSSGSKPIRKSSLSDGNPRSEYLQQLRDLNEGVLQWIKSHVDSNPFCILTPVFDDYAKHLKEIQLKKPGPASEKARMRSDTQADHKETEATPVPLIVAAPAATTVVSSDMLLSAASRISSSETTGAAAALAVKSTMWSTMKPVSVDPAKFTFGLNVVNPAGKESKPGEGEDVDEYVPPKNIVSEIKEVDALYSIRCKLFYKKDTSYVEKGVGTLYLKSLGSKTQLFVRAETSLGNMLLNIELISSLPTQRIGKNHVTLVCVPNPPINPKIPCNEPVTFLIRVKNNEEADDLLTNLQKYKS